MQSRTVKGKFKVESSKLVQKFKVRRIALGTRLFTLAGVLGVAIASVATMPARLIGQAPQPSAGAPAPSIPRTADGHPDLQGTYDLATLTPVERPAGMPAVLTNEEAKKLERQVEARTEISARPIRSDREAPPVGGDGSVGAAGNVGGYNTFWLDPGSAYTIVNGQKRSSLIVDPPDGRVPAMTAEARARLPAARTVQTSDQTARENDPGLEGPGAFDDPEKRPLGERCLLGFGSTSGPPVFPNYFYNNLHQIVQTPGHVMILTEMVHDARIIRMNAPHLPSSCANGWATRSGAGRATRWWSTRRTSPTRRASAARPRTFTSSSASPASMRTRCSTGSRWTIRRRGPDRGRANTPGR